MCDTFVALGPASGDGAVVFGKNSDREPNEAQALEYHPGARHPAGAALKCTYIEIPQAPETLAALISRPFWMWGAEFGANEKGVVIGNEAVFTRLPRDKKPALLGMDLLRLALERGPSAEEALETIVRLLSDHGQGGPCGYEDKKLAYHNSFIIAAPDSAWVLETAGPLWAAKRIAENYAISNALTIGEDFDRSHPDLIDFARDHGRLKKGENFHFARAYSDWFFTFFSASRARRGRAAGLLERFGRINPAAAMAILRDHREEPYYPDKHPLMNRVCAHAANGLTGTPPRPPVPWSLT